MLLLPGSKLPSSRTRPGFAFWATVLLVVLHVLSSGPTRMIGTYAQQRSGNRLVPEPDALTSGNWYANVYRPLARVRYCPWARPLRWHWSLFPIPGA